MKESSHVLGTSFETDRFFLFYGNKSSSRESLTKAFPNLNFSYLKQTHSDQIISWSSPVVAQIPEADAHITAEKNHALFISTADCMPIFIFSENPGYIAAIHAGWRGVAAQIVPKTILKLKQLGCSESHLQFLIGPHIRKNSFEIKQDALHLLKQSTRAQDSSWFKEKSENSYLADLEKLLEFQLFEAGFKNPLIQSYNRDTFSDKNYHSYRRDRENSGRQQSFIYLK